MSSRETARVSTTYNRCSPRGSRQTVDAGRYPWGRWRWRVPGGVFAGCVEGVSVLKHALQGPAGSGEVMTFGQEFVVYEPSSAKVGR